MQKATGNGATQYQRNSQDRVPYLSGTEQPVDADQQTVARVAAP